MRTMSRNGVVLMYPDEVGFAFNACLLVVKGAEVSTMTIEMTSEDGSTVTDSRDAFSGGCYADVREYIQGFFDCDVLSRVGYDERERTKTGQRVLFRVSAGGEVFDFVVFYVWGAMKAGGGEVFNGPRTLRAFVGYPFTLGVYLSGEDVVRMINKTGSVLSVDIVGQGIWNIPLEVSEGDVYLITSDEGGIRQATFDSTFDITFRLEAYALGNNLRVEVGDDVTDGIYLRWIDRHGFYRYWLFERGANKVKVANEGQFVRNNIMSVDLEYGYNGGLGRQMIMNRQEVVPVCAPLVDSETWDMLSDMVSSPILDMFMGYVDGESRWLSVQAEAATYTKAKAVLQDFVANITMPDVQIQKL